MFVAVAINIVSHDVASRIDPVRIRRNSSRNINRSKGAFAQQKSMIVAVAINRDPDDVASRIDTKGPKHLCGSRHIDCRKFSLSQEKTMDVISVFVATAAFIVEPYDVASRIDRLHIGQGGSG